MKKLFLILSFLIVFAGGAFAIEDVPVKLSTFAVKNDWGLKDENGNIVVEAKYRKLVRVGDSTWIVRRHGRYGLINNNGDIIVPIRYRHTDRILGKFAKFGNFNDFGLYDEYGNMILSHDYSSIDLLYGKMFLTCYKHKFGVTDFSGKELIENDYDDIYMPDFTTIRVLYNGTWYELKKYSDEDIKTAESSKRVSFKNQDITITKLVTETGKRSSYYAVSATDYTMKLLSSISPAYEETIDDLMLSHGADTVAIIANPIWIVQFPYVYAKKYISNVLAPNNGPLSGVKQKIKRGI